MSHKAIGIAVIFLDNGIENLGQSISLRRRSSMDVGKVTSNAVGLTVCCNVVDIDVFEV